MEPVLEDPNSFLERHFALPPLPSVVDRLTGRLDSGRANAADVAELLAADPGLAARLLKIVNSAYYGLPVPIRDIKHAVAYLGLTEIRRAAVTVGVMEALRPAEARQFEAFWFHSFHTALGAKLLARRATMVLDAEELHVAALLHDVGKLIYLKFFPGHLAKLLDHCKRNGVLMLNAERELNLPSHTVFGARLCERWMLPGLVARACRRHELQHLDALIEEGSSTDELKVICLANLLSNLCTEELADRIKTEIKESAVRALNIGDDEFLLLMGELYDLRTEVQRLLDQLRPFTSPESAHGAGSSRSCGR